MKKGLGRGLDALFQDNESEIAQAAEGGAPAEVAVADIEPNRGQPRHVFDEEKLRELAGVYAAYQALLEGSAMDPTDRVAAAAWSFSPFTTARCRAERKFSSWGGAAAAAGAEQHGTRERRNR